MKLSQLFAAVSITLSCSAFSQESGSSYFPFTVGARWVYSVEFVFHDAGIRQGKLEVRVDGKEEINGIEYFREVALFSGITLADSDISFWRVGNSGVFRIDGRHKDEGEVLDTPFPLRVGSDWTAQKESTFVRCRVEGYQTLEVLREEYSDCLKISSHGKSGEGVFDGVAYYARGVGLVRQVLKSKWLTTDMVLEKYEK